MTATPNFIYIGPDKAGSSWLHEVLITHPQIYLTPAKDLYFFDRYFDKGSDWYLSHFEDAHPEQRVIGEVCQDYLSEPEAPSRIRDVLGRDIRFMVTLRDPVERAFSSYLYMLKHGETPGSFADALVGRPELIEHGSYGAGLARFLDIFPRDQLHVALFDDLVADPQAFIDDVLRFLAVGPMTLSDDSLAARLPASRARSVGMARAVRKAAEWARLANGAEFVGRVKRSRYLQAALYKPYGDDKPRLSREDAQRVRDLLADDVALLEGLIGVPVRARWGWPTKAIAS
jgi:hypothetical protein